MSDVVISGYYGFRNNGDDALLTSIIEDLKKRRPDIDIVVLSKNPQETQRIYNVRAVSRENVFAVAGELLKTKMLISGGGTLMQDGTSTKSLLYYLWIIQTALVLRKKVMLYANGIGPLNSARNIERARKVLNRVDLITLRDMVSREELEKIGVDRPVIKVTADPAFGLASDDGQTPLLESYEIPSDKPLLCVSVREWKHCGNDFCDILARVCDYACYKYDMHAVFLPMQPQNDYAITVEIKKKMNAGATVVKTDYDIGRLLSLFGQMHMCIGMRLHTLIYSAVSCVPLVGLVYDPKVSGFLDYIGLGNYCDVTTMTEEELRSAVDKCITEYDDIKEELIKNRAELKRKAEQNAELAVTLLDGGDVS